MGALPERRRAARCSRREGMKRQGWGRDNMAKAPAQNHTHPCISTCRTHGEVNLRASVGSTLKWNDNIPIMLLGL